MPYVAGEYRVQVRGTAGGQAEQWNNTWCLIDPTGVQDIQEAASILNAFYGDIGAFASWLSVGWDTVAATAKNLATGISSDMVWTYHQGSSAASVLPQQLAMRVSLKSGIAAGGPFLSGFVVTAVDADGGIEDACVADFITALETMCDDLTAAGWQLGLDQPTAGLATQVTSGRVGTRWDVIRKRANELPEVYVPFSVS